MGDSFRCAVLTLCFCLAAFCLGTASHAGVVEQEGEACAPDFRTAKEQALAQAKRLAVETYLGTLLDSRALVINGKLLRDIIQTTALGQIKLIGGPKIISAKPDTRTETVCVKVLAKFELDKSRFSRANFGLKLLLNKKNFKSGEELKITLYAEKKCHPYLFSVDSLGNVYRLLPNHIEPHPVIQGTMMFPTEKMALEGLMLKAAAYPDGPEVQREELLFICLRKPDKALRDLFPEAFAPDDTCLRRRLRRNLPALKEKDLLEILNDIGLQNYEVIDAQYVIHPT